MKEDWTQTQLQPQQKNTGQQISRKCSNGLVSREFRRFGCLAKKDGFQSRDAGLIHIWMRVDFDYNTANMSNKDLRVTTSSSATNPAAFSSSKQGIRSHLTPIPHFPIPPDSIYNIDALLWKSIRLNTVYLITHEILAVHVSRSLRFETLGTFTYPRRTARFCTLTSPLPRDCCP